MAHSNAMKITKDSPNIADNVYHKNNLTVKPKQFVTVAHSFEGVVKDITQTQSQTIRLDDDFTESQSESEKPEESKPSGGNYPNALYSTPIKSDSIVNFCWWRSCCPMHNCKICVLFEPSFWNVFLRKVLVILYAMLMLTAAFIFYITSTPDVAKTFHKNAAMTMPASIFALLLLNYFMLCFVAGRFYCVSYFVLLFVVVSYALLLGALSALLETEAFLYAILTSASVTMVLFGITFARCFCFTRWCLVLPIALGTALGSMVVFHLFLSNFYVKSYPLRHLFLIVAMVVIHAVVLTFEIRRLLCINSINPCCLDYGLGAYLLYTMFLQVIFYWVYLLFNCLHCRNQGGRVMGSRY